MHTRREGCSCMDAAVFSTPLLVMRSCLFAARVCRLSKMFFGYPTDPNWGNVEPKSEENIQQSAPRAPNHSVCCCCRNAGSTSPSEQVEPSPTSRFQSFVSVCPTYVPHSCRLRKQAIDPSGLICCANLSHIGLKLDRPKNSPYSFVLVGPIYTLVFPLSFYTHATWKTFFWCLVLSYAWCLSYLLAPFSWNFFIQPEGVLKARLSSASL